MARRHTGSGGAAGASSDDFAHLPRANLDCLMQ
jgi:hypothetical protein